MKASTKILLFFVIIIAPLASALPPCDDVPIRVAPILTLTKSTDGSGKYVLPLIKETGYNDAIATGGDFHVCIGTTCTPNVQCEDSTETGPSPVVKCLYNDPSAGAQEISVYFVTGVSNTCIDHEDVTVKKDDLAGNAGIAILKTVTPAGGGAGDRDVKLEVFSESAHNTPGNYILVKEDAPKATFQAGKFLNPQTDDTGSLPTTPAGIECAIGCGGANWSTCRQDNAYATSCLDSTVSDFSSNDTESILYESFALWNNDPAYSMAFSVAVGSVKTLDYTISDAQSSNTGTPSVVSLAGCDYEVEPVTLNATNASVSGSGSSYTLSATTYGVSPIATLEFKVKRATTSEYVYSPRVTAKTGAATLPLIYNPDPAHEKYIAILTDTCTQFPSNPIQVRLKMNGSLCSSPEVTVEITQDCSTYFGGGGSPQPCSSYSGSLGCKASCVAGEQQRPSTDCSGATPICCVKKGSFGGETPGFDFFSLTALLGLLAVLLAVKLLRVK